MQESCCHVEVMGVFRDNRGNVGHVMTRSIKNLTSAFLKTIIYTPSRVTSSNLLWCKHVTCPFFCKHGSMVYPFGRLMRYLQRKARFPLPTSMLRFANISRWCLDHCLLLSHGLDTLVHPTSTLMKGDSLQHRPSAAPCHSPRDARISRLPCLSTLSFLARAT